MAPALCDYLAVRVAKVHIGYHKTGTTAIQHAIAQSLDQLDHANIVSLSPLECLALVRGFNSDDDLVRRRNLYGRRLRGNRVGNGTGNHQKLFEASLAARWLVEERSTPSGCLVLSEEGFSQLEPSGVAAFAEWIYSVADTVEVYGYVRNPVLWAESWFDQRVKDQTFPIDLRDPVDAIPPRLNGDSFLDLSASLPLWLEHFGQVRLRTYSRDQFVDGSIVDNFAEFTGLPPLADTSRDANRMVGAKAATFLCGIRPHTSIERQDWMRGARAIRGDDRVVFGVDYRREISARLEKSTAFVSSLLPADHVSSYLNTPAAPATFPAALTDEDLFEMTGKFVGSLAPGKR